MYDPKCALSLINQTMQENIIPHSSLLILFTTSAQTHIFPEIRIDAIRFLDLFLDVVPDAVISSWMEGSAHGNRVLGGYLGILNAGIKFGETDGECMNIVCSLTSDMRLDPVQATSTSAVLPLAVSRILHHCPTHI